MLRRDLTPSRKKAIKRVLMSRRLRSTGPTPEVVQAVVFRDGGRCVRCGEDLSGQRGYGWSLHHRRGRDGKPDSHEPQNLASVCGGDNVTGCHGQIHRLGKGDTHGWWLSRAAGVDPLLVPMFVARLGVWVYLTADGEYGEEVWCGEGPGDGESFVDG